MFKGIFRFCFSCFFPPDEAHTPEKKANEAYNAYRMSPGKSDTHSLEAAIVYYRESIPNQPRSDTDLEYASSTFHLANMHWEAYNAPVAPAVHLREAIQLYEKTVGVWKNVNPKPEGYLELLRNLGKAHYDLFDTDIGQQTKSTLRESTRYYDRAFEHAKNQNMSPNPSEYHQILGSITWKGCKLEKTDIRLDQAIDQLSSAYKAHTSDIPIFEDSSCPHLVNVRSAVDHLTSIIDRSPNSPQIRDQALLHLCQALLFRFNFRGKGADLCDLIRAEAVARSAIPVVSQDVGLELKNILVLIQHRNDQRGIDEGIGSSSTYAGLSRTTSQNGLPVTVDNTRAPSALASVPQGIRPYTIQTATAPSSKGHECQDGAPYPPPKSTPLPLPKAQGFGADRQRVPLSQSKNALPTPQLPATHRSNQKHPVAAMLRMSQSSI